MINKKGFTLTEIILTMSVAAIIIIMGLLVYKKVHNKAQENLIITTLNNLSSNIDSLYGYGYIKSSNNNFNQATQDYIFKDDFPNNKIDIIDVGSNIYGGNGYFTKGDFMLNYQLGVNQTGSNSKIPYNIVIFIIVVPQEICADLTEQIVSKGEFFASNSNGDELYASPSNTSASTLGLKLHQDMNPNNYASLCSGWKFDSEHSIIGIERIF